MNLDTGRKNFRNGRCCIFQATPYKQKTGPCLSRGTGLDELIITNTCDIVPALPPFRGQGSAHQVLELELNTNADYPYTPATAHELPTEESILALWKSGTWIFGVGSGIASRAIVSLHTRGVRNFSTGGAASNAASLATVASLGFSVDEIWRSYSKLS